MDQQQLKTHDYEPTSFLQELSDPNNCLYYNSQQVDKNYQEKVVPQRNAEISGAVGQEFSHTVNASCVYGNKSRDFAGDYNAQSADWTVPSQYTAPIVQSPVQYNMGYSWSPCASSGLQPFYAPQRPMYQIHPHSEIKAMESGQPRFSVSNQQQLGFAYNQPSVNYINPSSSKLPPASHNVPPYGTSLPPDEHSSFTPTTNNSPWIPSSQVGVPSVKQSANLINPFRQHVPSSVASQDISLAQDGRSVFTYNNVVSNDLGASAAYQPEFHIQRNEFSAYPNPIQATQITECPGAKPLSSGDTSQRCSSEAVSGAPFSRVLPNNGALRRNMTLHVSNQTVQPMSNDFTHVNQRYKPGSCGNTSQSSDGTSVDTNNTVASDGASVKPILNSTENFYAYGSAHTNVSGASLNVSGSVSVVPNSTVQMCREIQSGISCPTSLHTAHPTMPFSSNQYDSHLSSPIPSGRSTFHYRQSTTPILHSNSSNGILSQCPVIQCGSGYPIQQDADLDDPRFQHTSPPIRFSDQHLQPIVPYPSVPTTHNVIQQQQPGDIDRCNGLKESELGPNFQPILPKVSSNGSPLTQESPSKPGRKRQAMDRETRNERRRQQRLRKKQIESIENQKVEDNQTGHITNAEVDPSVSKKTSTKRQSKPRKKLSQSDAALSSTDTVLDTAVTSDTVEASLAETSTECSVQSTKKRRGSLKANDAKRTRKTKVDTPELSSDSIKCETVTDEISTLNESHEATLHAVDQTDDDVAVTESQEPKPPRIIRTRPPRPKKKRPLPTLIRKKRRSAFYGNESDSEPDVSGRTSVTHPASSDGQFLVRNSVASSNSNATNLDRKRRSERNLGDRKRYTVDLELDLSDDESDENGNGGDMANQATTMVEDDSKVVECVLGRRTTKRIVKRVIRRDPGAADDGACNNKENKPTTEASEEEEEEEEDVEEFYLKYKGLSYLHCEWRALDEIEDPRIRPKLRRFELKQAHSLQTEDDDVVLFNPDYVEVERVLDMRVYRNGQLLSPEKLREQTVRDSIVDPAELKKQIKRERERKRARALREARVKARAEADAMVLTQSSSQTDLASQSTPLTEDVLDSEATSRDVADTIVEEDSLSRIQSVSPVASKCARDSPKSEANEDAVSTGFVEETAVIDKQVGDTGPARARSDSFVSQPDSSVTTPLEQSDDTKIETNSTIRTLLGADHSVIDSPVIASEPNLEEEVDGHDDNASEKEDEPSSPVNVTYYLVKWRSLAYEDATWELAQDVDPTKVKEFLRLQRPPKFTPIPRDSNYKIIRPDPKSWHSIELDAVYKNDNKLRDYQLEGVNWLTYCWFHHRNCILADEMGLGKTVQSVAFLMEIVQAGIRGPFLVIVPLSTVANWQREFENWSDFNVVVYHGSSVSRNMIQQYEIFYRRTPSNTVRHDVYKFHAVITTFEILMTDIEFFGQIHWAASIIDEAHRLKNKKCKLGEGLRYLDLDHRVLLTGTPLQNNVEELFGLLNFLEPERFSCSSTFVAEYGDLKTEEQVESLKALLKPMMLRRLKEDVEKSLAPKEETIVEVELTNIQKKYYRAIMERNFTFLCKGSTSANAPNLMNVMMELRKCCNHPFLIKGAEDAILTELHERQATSEDVQKPSPNRSNSEDTLTFQGLVYASGKLVLVHKLLPKLRADGHKVLVFSQMIRVLDILEDYLIHQRYPFERIDGRIHGPLRQEAIDRFTADPDKFVFLLCTKAGGLGINLTAADVVIIYDSDWNPQNDLQAQARCHRIGQQKMVKVYRLITRNTYEREMFDRASLKLGLDRAVLQSMGSKEARQAQMSKKEIEELLKKGAYGALMDDDKAGEDFCEEDIDKILQSRAQVIQLEQGEKNSTFSKATFSMSDNRSDIELDDPNFWQKWAKMAGVDEDEMDMKDLILKTPRQRRQTTRYSSTLINEQKNVASPASYDVSDDSTNAQSSGDDTGPPTSNNRGRFRRQRRHHRRLNQRNSFSGTRRQQIPTTAATDETDLVECVQDQVEPLDRADMFRVERCLLTWSWGHWDTGLATVPFKRTLTPTELSYFGSVVLAYALRFLGDNADVRVRVTIAELSRSGVWKRSLAELAKTVSLATTKANVTRNHTQISLATSDQTAGADESEVPSSLLMDIESDLKSSKQSSEIKLSDSTSVIPLADSDFIDNAPNTPTEVIESNEACNQDVASEPTDGQSVITNLVKEEDSTKSKRLTEQTYSPDSNMDTTDTCLAEEKPSCEADVPSDSMNALEPEVKPAETGGPLIVSPKTMSFNPDKLLHCEGFRKHVQRHSVRLMNRVSFLFFLQCEVIGIGPSKELIAGRFTHTDFNELASSLPPLDAIDSDLPAPWWDSCCDKCLLLGVLKHGWEKYYAMRVDPSLCFWSRALANWKNGFRAADTVLAKTDDIPEGKLARMDSEISEVELQETPSLSTSPVDDEKPDIDQLLTDVGDQSPSVIGDEAEPVEKTERELELIGTENEDLKQELSSLEVKVERDVVPSADEVSESMKPEMKKAVTDDEGESPPEEEVLYSLLFPAVADLNSRVRKIVGFFQRMKSQFEADVYKRQAYIDEDEDPEQFGPSTFSRFVDRRCVKWTRREEADFYRVVSSYGVEFQVIESSPSAMTGCLRGSISDTTLSPKQQHHQTPVMRRYDWTNFRQLANLSRKADISIVEYFQSFYRMCQRVCKRNLTVFAGPASTAATTTTSGSSKMGDEVPIDPISEERANRCLSRIDLLARIRNQILPHPQLAERLCLCQRSSDIPGWWIPGKHDGELLRAAAKHGLSRTDLNILTDPEFTFARIISLIREKLSQESAVLDYPGDAGASQLNRANIAAAAAAAARSAAVQLVNEEMNEKQKHTTAPNVSNYHSKSPESDLPGKTVGQAAGASSTDQQMDNLDTEVESISLLIDDSDKPHHLHDSEDPVSIKSGSPSKNLVIGNDATVASATTFGADDGQKNATCENEWSVKFATNLATAWPKDRTIQHRLELVCQTVETNQWPTPRRYLPVPNVTTIPMGDPKRYYDESTRLLNLPNYNSSLRQSDGFVGSPGITGKSCNVTYASRSICGTSTPHTYLATPSNKDSPHMGSPASTIRSPSTKTGDDAMMGSHLLGDTPTEERDSLGGYDSPLPLNLVSSPKRTLQASFNDSASFSSESSSLYPPDQPTRRRSIDVYAPTPRGRGRGRGRGSRGGSYIGRSAGSRGGRGAHALRVDGDCRITRAGLHSPQSVGGSEYSLREDMKQNTDSSAGVPEVTSAKREAHTMPPPTFGTIGRRGAGGSGRGRKRRGDYHRQSTDYLSTQSPSELHQSKRERLDSGPNTESGRSSKASTSRIPVASTSTDSDVWNVRVPVISLVDGSIIYGDKAPKRRALEAWLEANPNYMPYSVEVEDRTIYNRVAGARGQDTSNMEALAYKHYVNSLIASASAGMYGSTSGNPTQPNMPSKSIGLTASQQQQYLLQQQQLFNAFGAYARHPSYAPLLASIMSNWQASLFASTNTAVSAPSPTTQSDVASSSSSNNSATGLSSVSTRARSAASRQHSTHETVPATDMPASSGSPVVPTTLTVSSESNTPTASSVATPSVASSSNAAATGMEAMLNAAYKQATANIACMYNPLTAAAYSQMMMNPTASTSSSSSDNSGSVNQQNAIASLYAGYVLSLRQAQMQQQQQQQSKAQQTVVNTWEQHRQQQQQLASVATVLAAAAATASGNTGANFSGLDPTSLMTALTTGRMGATIGPVSEASWTTTSQESSVISSAHSQNSTISLNHPPRASSPQSIQSSSDPSSGTSAVPSNVAEDSSTDAKCPSVQQSSEEPTSTPQTTQQPHSPVADENSANDATTKVEDEDDQSVLDLSK